MPACPPARALFSDGIFNAQTVIDPPELVAVILFIFWEGIFIARSRRSMLIPIAFVNALVLIIALFLVMLKLEMIIRNSGHYLMICNKSERTPNQAWLKKNLLKILNFNTIYLGVIVGTKFNSIASVTTANLVFSF